MTCLREKAYNITSNYEENEFAIKMAKCKPVLLLSLLLIENLGGIYMNRRIEINENAYVDFYIKDPVLDVGITGEFNRDLPLLLVLPGGGYSYVSLREGQPVATRANAYGMHSAVLKYTVLQEDIDVTLDQLLAEVEFVLDYIDENAHELRIDTSKIYVAGFSAGGHLASWSSIKFNDRIDRAILAYPAVGYGPEYLEEIKAREEEADLSKYDENNAKIALRMAELFSLDPKNAVHDKTPPTFIFTTMDDRTVPAGNSLRYATKLYEYNVPLELHCYSVGGHALSLADNTTAVYKHQINPRVATWVDLAFTWLRTY